MFISFVKQYKIFVLTETHLLSDQNQYIENIFYDYHLCWTPAEKNSKFGRASGGIVCGIQLNSGLIEMTKFENYHNLLVLSMEICKQKIKFVPLYLNGGRWDGDFNLLNQYVELNSISNFILKEDCNIRVGELQVLPIESLGSCKDVIKTNRISKDKTVN